MRRVLAVGVAGLFCVTAAAMTGCGSDDKKAQIPDKTIDVPKQGPAPAGVPGGAPAGNQPGQGKQPAAD